MWQWVLIKIYKSLPRNVEIKRKEEKRCERTKSLCDRQLLRVRLTIESYGSASATTIVCACVTTRGTIELNENTVLGSSRGEKDFVAVVLQVELFGL